MTEERKEALPLASVSAGAHISYRQYFACFLRVDTIANLTFAAV